MKPFKGSLLTVPHARYHNCRDPQSVSSQSPMEPGYSDPAIPICADELKIGIIDNSGEFDRTNKLIHNIFLYIKPLKSMR